MRALIQNTGAAFASLLVLVMLQGMSQNAAAAPTVTSNAANLAVNAPQMIITGTGFSTTIANDTVALSSGTATVTAATATQLTVTLGGTLSMGSLTACV